MGPLIANLRISFIALFVVVSVGGGGGGSESVGEDIDIRGVGVGGSDSWYEWSLIHGLRHESLSLQSPFCQSRAGGPVTKSAIVLIKFHFAEFMKREAIFEV